jgi:hypothetical protein
MVILSARVTNSASLVKSDVNRSDFFTAQLFRLDTESYFTFVGDSMPELNAE